MILKANNLNIRQTVNSPPSIIIDSSLSQGKSAQLKTSERKNEMEITKESAQQNNLTATEHSNEIETVSTPLSQLEASVEKQNISSTTSDSLPKPHLDELFNEKNLIFKSEDSEVYTIPAEIDTEELSLLTGSSSEFTQNHHWKSASVVDNPQNRAIIEGISTRLQALEECQEKNGSLIQELKNLEARLEAIELTLAQLENLEKKLVVIDGMSNCLQTLEAILPKLPVINERFEVMKNHLEAIQKKIALLTVLEERLLTSESRLKEMEAKTNMLEKYCGYLLSLIQSGKPLDQIIINRDDSGCG